MSCRLRKYLRGRLCAAPTITIARHAEEPDDIRGPWRGACVSMKGNILIVSEDDSGRRLDNFLAGRLKRMRLARVHRMIRRGEVRVNRGRAASGHRLRAGDKVRLPPFLDRRPPPPVAARARWIEQCVLYEDDSLLVLNKPAGLAVHAGGSVNLGAVELLRASRSKEDFLQLAHRLDRATSGCLVLARKPRVLTGLHREFRRNAVEKAYVALLAGGWTGAERRVKLPLDRSYSGGPERRVRAGSGQPAETRYIPSRGWGNATLVRAIPITGRTHQIRVHAAAIGHPVLGDDRYGRSGAELAERIALKRLFLHASEVKFTHPQTLRELCLRAPLPDELRSVLERLGSPEFGRAGRKT